MLPECVDDKSFVKYGYTILKMDIRRSYAMEQFKVARWGNSLAIRLPSDLVRELGVKEGDYIERDRLSFYKVRPRQSREEALKVMRDSRMKLPEGYKFDRDEANSRG